MRSLEKNCGHKDPCGGHTVVVYQLPKLIARVRFPSPACILLGLTERSDVSLSKIHAHFSQNYDKHGDFLKKAILVLLVFCGGCATEYKALPDISTTTTITTPSKQGVYHKVSKGETLWRIAKFYSVPVDDIIQSNHIPNIAAIEVNQLIFIPGATEAQEIPAARTADEKSNEFAWPVKGRLISFYNDRKGEALNRGIDIEAAEGDMVKASREGTVVMARYMAGYGHTIMVNHGDGFISVYAQNRRLLSKIGDQVYKGDPIAEVGRLGKRNYMHFELRRGNQAVNPLHYLPS